MRVDVVDLSRLQFAVTIIYHFLFVPLSIGLGLVVALAERRFYRSGNPQDRAASDFLIKLFAATFAVGVATGISMEFAFGTNWAAYSRFVGDVFGAPLAAEGIFAFFLESTFLGILIFGRKRVSKRLFHASAWLVWAGSLLSALWILIANSWMQTPAGYEIVGTGIERKAVLTDFFAAAFNPSTVARYLHTIDATLMVGGFLAMAIGAHYLLQEGHRQFATTTMATGITIALISTVLMLPAGHMQALTVVDNQPSKLAAFEGQWEDGPMDLGIIGWINVDDGTSTILAIPNGVNLLAGDFSGDRTFAGLNSFAEEDRPPLQLTFQTYHWMILLWGVMLVIVIMVRWFNRRKQLVHKRWLLKTLVISPVLPMLAIQLGWAAAEVGRQPWIVWGELRTADAISAAVPAGEVLITLILFVLFYTFIYVAWVRVVLGFLRRGPEKIALIPEHQPSGREEEKQL